MKKIMKQILILLLIHFSIVNVFGQVTLYSEDFSDASLNGKGQNGSVFDVSGVTNWTVDVSGAVTMSGTDRFMQTGGLFESNNTDAPENPGALWYSLSVDISCYTNVTVSTVLSRGSSNLLSGVQAYYIIDGGAPVSFGALTGSGATPINASATGFAGNTMQIMIKHWGTSSTPSYRHDDVLITGEYSTAICPISASSPICGGYITDSDAGTTAGNYGNDINYTSIVCPSVPGELTTVTFEGLDIGAGDVLNIFEGDDITGASLGTITSATAVGFEVSSYDCITFNWITDGSDDGNEGFWGSITCEAPSTGNPPASDDFADAPLICDLSTYSGSTAGNTADNPFNMAGGGNCPTLFGGTIENNSWFSFIATSTSIDILVTPTSCNFGGGIQAAILAFDGSNFTRISECVFSDGTQSFPFNLTAFEAPLVVGDTYYVMVDGNAGSTCTYDMEMQTGFTPLSINASPTAVCSEGASTLTVSNATTTNLIWFADDPSFGSEYGSPLAVNPTVTTIYTVLAQGECARTAADVIVTVNACPCAISNLSAGTQAACSPSDDTYTQEVVVTYTNAPASGTLNVNGQSFAITSSPQTVTLINLLADGNPVNVTAVFSDDVGCTLTSSGLFSAPVSCSTPCAPDNGTWD